MIRRCASILTRHAPILTGLGAALALLAGLFLTTAQAATADDSADTAGYLTLSSNPSPAEWTSVGPGDVIDWSIDADLRHAPAADLVLRLSGHGPLVDQGLRIAVTSCVLTAPNRRCGTERTPVVARRVPAGIADARWQLGVLTSGHPVTLFVTLTVPESARITDGRTEVGIGLAASGRNAEPAGVPPVSENVGLQPPTQARPQGRGPLASTGVSVWGPVLLGLGLAGAGLAASQVRRRRSL